MADAPNPNAGINAKITPLTVAELDRLTSIQKGEPKAAFQWGVVNRIRAAMADREARLPHTQDPRPSAEDPA